MKPKERTHNYQYFWVTGLTVGLFLLGQFLIADAQAAKPQITTTGADDTFDQVLAQPAKFLQSLGLTPEQVQKQLKAHPRIAVVGAGFARNLGSTPLPGLPDTQQTQSSIQVEGAGAARVVRLAAFTDIPSSPVKPGIHVVGAGFARDIGLASPVLP